MTDIQKQVKEFINNLNDNDLKYAQILDYLRTHFEKFDDDDPTDMNMGHKIISAFIECFSLKDLQHLESECDSSRNDDERILQYIQREFEIRTSSEITNISKESNRIAKNAKWWAIGSAIIIFSINITRSMIDEY